MTQFSIPQDGNDGDGGVYNAATAGLELTRPYYVTDNPVVYGLCGKDVVITTTVNGSFTAGKAKLHNGSYILYDDIVVQLPNASYGWIAVLVDNREGQYPLSTFNTYGTILLHNAIGGAYAVPAYSIGIRFSYMRDVFHSKNINPECIPLYVFSQYHQVGEALPQNIQIKRLVNDYITAYDVSSGMTMNIPDIRPNSFRLTGFASTFNAVEHEASIYISLTVGLSESSDVPIPTIFKFANTAQAADSTVNSFVVPIHQLHSDISEPTHVVFDVNFEVFGNYLLVVGDIILHSLPLGNTDVHNAVRIASGHIQLSGIVDLSSIPDWKLSYFKIDDIDEVGIFPANTTLEVTYR